MKLIDVFKAFATDEQCLAYLERRRWPNGVRCIVCGHDKISRITRESKTKNKRAQIYQCLEPTCKQQFSVTTGTIFHDSHLPLAKWFTAIALIVDAKKGISALQLQRHLGCNYRTAWFMSHRIREAMVDLFPTKLSGIVEVDETYIGGKAIRRGIARGIGKPPRPKKDMVIGMRERDGRVRFFHVPNLKADTMKKLLDRHISSGVRRIMTDSAIVYDFAMDKDFQTKHETVNHSREWVKPGDIDVHTNTVESAFSLLKRGLTGSFHRVSIKHLHRYLAEFEWRFNARKDDDRFEQTVSRMAGSIPMPYSKLVADSAEQQA